MRSEPIARNAGCHFAESHDLETRRIYFTGETEGEYIHPQEDGDGRTC